ncbi:MAG: flagellar basal body rod C-terminal domain-containing protein [Desulfurivibrionaceae bacterium]|nr:flagellar basal body rod C-terminal domain-containing protein [Desulfurivibrionaceae bacterium]
MVSGINTSLSALTSLATKVQSTANNVANVNTEGYQATRVTLQEVASQEIATAAGSSQVGLGVAVASVERSTSPALPGSSAPPGSAPGFVENSNVDLATEFTTMMISKTSYRANIKMIQAGDEMIGNLLDIKS